MDSLGLVSDDAKRLGLRLSCGSSCTGGDPRVWSAYTVELLDGLNGSAVPSVKLLDVPRGYSQPRLRHHRGDGIAQEAASLTWDNQRI